LPDPTTTRFLQNIPIWINYRVPDAPLSTYHYGNPTEKYPAFYKDSISVNNADDYLKTGDASPAKIFHEMAHAWHYGQRG